MKVSRFKWIPAFLLQPSHVVPIGPGLDARRRRACFESVGHACKALVQEYADLWVLSSDQREISLLLLFCHPGLLKEGAITGRYVGIITNGVSLLETNLLY
jgi:hypothetical protein